MHSMSDFMLASFNLSAFIKKEAAHYASILNFKIIPSLDAPGDFESLLSEYTQAKKTSDFRVYSGACENTIYTDIQANIAFRFWHDILHVKHNLKFTTADEVALGNIQAARVGQVFGIGSLEYKMIWQDVIGQALFFQKTGQFVENQKQFIIELLSITE